MASIEGLQKVQESFNQGADSFTSGIQDLNRMQVAQQAGELFKKGDVQGAYGLLMKADPGFAEKIAPHVAAISPDYAQTLAKSQTVGKLQGLDEYGSTAAQLERMKLQAAQAKLNKPVVRSDPNSPTGFSLISPNGGVMPFDAYSGQQPSQPSSKPLSKAQGNQTASKPEGGDLEQPPKPEKPPTLRPNEAIDSTGQKVMLAPAQLKEIDKARSTFDKATGKIVDQMRDGEQAYQMIANNFKGAEPLEKLRILKTVVQGRINQQEFQAFGADMGIFTQAENAFRKGGTGQMSPTVQKALSDIVGLALKKAHSEYDQALKFEVGRHPTVDPFILKQRIAGSDSAPTVFQQTVKQVQQMPPEGQALYNWAHDHPEDPRSKGFMDQLMQKYGVGF